MEDKTLKLKAGRLGRFRPAHPWFYKNQFLKTAAIIKGGEIISVLDQNGNFIGRGYYNPSSEIAVRILTFQREEIGINFFKDRIEKALKKREALKDKTDSYRVIFSEADGLPGLIADLYNRTVVFQVLTLGIERKKELVIEAIKDKIPCDNIYEKSDGIYRRYEGLKVVKSWQYGKGSRYTQIQEGPAKFIIDIYEGHKTGFYLDQRVSRLAIGPFVKGKKVLDLFSYLGAFSAHAAINAASKVTAVDVKQDWLDLGFKNARINGIEDRIEFIKSDAFTFLEKAFDSGERFDTIIVDPPSFLRTKHALKNAVKGYTDLNYMAMKLLNDNGILATFSCSHNMPNELFSSALKSAALKAGKKISIIKRCHQDIDHPIMKTMPETEYLKGYFLRVGPVS